MHRDAQTPGRLQIWLAAWAMQLQPQLQLHGVQCVECRCRQLVESCQQARSCADEWNSSVAVLCGDLMRGSPSWVCRGQRICNSQQQLREGRQRFPNYLWQVSSRKGCLCQVAAGLRHCLASPVYLGTALHSHVLLVQLPLLADTPAILGGSLAEGPGLGAKHNPGDSSISYSQEKVSALQ